MISMEQLRLSQEKVSCEGPLGAARGIRLGCQKERRHVGANLLQKV